jgi:DNA-binding Lrp family transcriptional regulator
MVEAYVLIMTAAETSRSALPRIREIEGVHRANIVAGEFDIIALVEAESPRALLRLVTEEIQSLDGVGRTRTDIILE